MENNTLDYDEEGAKPAKIQTYTTIGGWLILPVLGMFISPFRLFYEAYNTFLPSLSSESLAQFDDPTSVMYNPFLKYLIYGELIGNLAFAIFAIVIVVYVFQYKAQTPRLFVIFYSANLLFIILDYVILMAMGYGNLEEYIDAEFIRTAIGCSIWIPYFLKSERVKGTFVK